MFPKEALYHIRRLQIKTTYLVDSLLAGAYRSAFKGRGIEFEGVREYQPGDDVNRIDWRLTAHMQHPFIKTFREERELTLMLAVDISASTRFGSKQRTKNAIIAEIGAVLALSAIRNHDKVGLLLFSDEIELYLRPQRNIRHVLRVIRELLFFAPQHKGTNIEKALAFLGKVQKKRTICFLISDFLTEGDFSHAINITAKRHDLILYEIYDNVERYFPSIGLAYIKDLESDELKLIDTASTHVHFNASMQHKQDVLKQLSQRLNIDLISMSCDESYTTALQRFFKWRGHKH